MVSLADKTFIFLDETFEHVKDKLLIVINEHSQDASDGQENLIPLEIAHLDLRYVVLGKFDFEKCKEFFGVSLSSNFEDESQSIDDFVSILVTLLLIVWLICIRH